ncbi:condensation domain-containing protein, partial [Chitinophaga sp. GbtcB8]|uniref:condensation domain-containing protein n=1 Tax=Chitinophaga sp. GbtcB8 TaxID=2824753 RepID=UPI001C2FB800
HHIVTDGWTVNILSRELETLYAAACKEDVLPPLHLQYKVYAHFMNSPAVVENLALNRQYWQQQSTRPAPWLAVPLDF